MNKSPEISNLTKYIVEPVRKMVGSKLEAYYYYDVDNEDDLTTNNKGIDIISLQLELKFKGKEPIFISWAHINGWHPYSISVSETSFCKGIKKFNKKDSNWEDLIGKVLRTFKVYGYEKNEITTSETATGRKTKSKYYNAHLLILHFDNDRHLGLANFYMESDFIPKYTMGDDIWIIFGKNYIDSYIKTLSLELLEA